MRTPLKRRIGGAAGSSGFTLIELLVVIIIIAILAAIAIPTYLGARIKAQDGAAVSLVRNALTVVESAYVEQRDYSMLTAATLQAIEPAITWNAGSVDLVDPTVPAVTAAVTASARARAVDYYGQSATEYDVASVSESGNRYGIQVTSTGGGAGAAYVKVKVIEGTSSLGW
jgi:type IV pilus assembly protein PilA